MKRRMAFSLVEVLTGLLLISILILSLFQVSRMSRAETMDASYRLTALSLAREPIEILRGLGYRGLVNYREHPLPAYPIGESFLAGEPVGGRHFPVLCQAFNRSISVDPIQEAGVRAVRILVRVYPRHAGWMNRQDCALEAIVPEDPAW